MTNPSVWIVPNVRPNADAIRIDLPLGTDISGPWKEVTNRLADLIPDGFHIVRIGNYNPASDCP